MLERKFAVVTLTTFGYKPKPLRIVQLTISKLKDGSYEPVLSTNINPEEQIPNYIQQKTGLTDEVLLKAPCFLELAEIIFKELEEYVIVGHNASFLHYALQSEFRDVGLTFKLPQLCTQRLAKKLIPDMLSYELSYLCGVLGIPLYNNDDVIDLNRAVSIMFDRLLQLDEQGKVVSQLLAPKEKNRVAMSANMENSQLTSLPSEPGIYKFQDQEGEVIYVGKAKNIKKRVLSHFSNTSDKEVLLCGATYKIDFEITGNELIALLREADLIHSLDPVYNYIQKKEYVTYHIIPQKNKKGILQLKIERRPFEHTPTEVFLKRGDAINRLIELTTKFELCPTYSGLKSKLGSCRFGDIYTCKGICKDSENISDYNQKVENALQYLNNEKENYVIFEKGRANDERSFVLVQHGVYQGYGFLDDSCSISGIDDLQNMMTPKRHTFHSANIISAYKKRNPKNVKTF
ncbi:exonuclease domain-containing protein [Zobellia alginiliquefaciens]|uniref:exonuclease domain-containing protein n=1 Tax=Zobellia alginiliquefaciens TaxID=3032586 RepID=UPI0023E3AA16|nr:exonuclease domain-containing protein [Zobellia alginiliquefaciens]